MLLSKRCPVPLASAGITCLKHVTHDPCANLRPSEGPAWGAAAVEEVHAAGLPAHGQAVRRARQVRAAERRAAHARAPQHGLHPAHVLRTIMPLSTTPVDACSRAPAPCRRAHHGTACSLCASCTPHQCQLLVLRPRSVKRASQWFPH